MPSNRQSGCAGQQPSHVHPKTASRRRRGGCGGTRTVTVPCVPRQSHSRRKQAARRVGCCQ
eukprot:3775010-Lingulodinium_polyedra.AAC.1